MEVTILAKLKGRKVNAPWGLGHEDTELLYHDEPRLVLRRSRSGDIYLGWWSDSDDSVERWLFLPVSRPGLRDVLTGRITVMDALRRPDTGHIFVEDINLATGDSKVLTTTIGNVPDDARPREGARLNIPVPVQYDDGPGESRLLLDRLVENMKRGRLRYFPPTDAQ